jgi:D-amino-acid dehydrogenase
MPFLDPPKRVTGATAIIIGGGISGMCAARELLLAGWRVTVLEAGPIGEGCSYANSGYLVPSHFTPLASPEMLALGMKMMFKPGAPLVMRPGIEGLRWVRLFMKAATKERVAATEPVLRDLHLASRALHLEFAKERPELQLKTGGLLMVCKSASTLAGESHAAARAVELGLRAEILDGNALREIEPLASPDLAGAVHFLDDGHLNPAAFMQAIVAEVRARGGRVLASHPALSVDVVGDKVGLIQTPQGGFEADLVVVASGALTERTGTAMGLDLPMLAGRGQSFVVPFPLRMPGTPAILMEARVALSPLAPHLRIAGGMRISPPGEGIDARRVEIMARAVGDYYPALRDISGPREGIWWGNRPLTPDGVPYLGRTRRLRNVIVAAGHGMLGFSLGPITGRLVAQAAGDSAVSLPGILDPDRYSA